MVVAFFTARTKRLGVVPRQWRLIRPMTVVEEILGSEFRLLKIGSLRETRIIRDQKGFCDIFGRTFAQPMYTNLGNERRQSTFIKGRR